jgi:hypothetical protein
MLIEIAGAMVKIEHRARLVVGELLEENGGFVVFVKNAAVHVAGKPRIETGERVSNSFADSCCTFWLGFGECFKALAQTRPIFMSDGKDADAALRTAGLADEMRAAAAIRIGDGAIHDLDERRQRKSS